jgi:tripartite ATP-independent transporter DctM subunit
MNENNDATQVVATDAGGSRGLNKAISILDKVGVFSRWTNIIGVGALFLMIIVAFVDVFARYVFNRPIQGVQEITEVIMICAVFFAVAHTQNIKSHIAIDIVVSRLRAKTRTVLEFITTLLSAGMLGIIAWRTFTYTVLVISDHRVHDKYFGIPVGPFAAIIFIGCAAITLLLIRDLLARINDALKLGLTWRYWLVMISVPTVFIVLSYLWMSGDYWHNMNLLTVGLIGIIFSVIMFFTGMPVAYVLAMTGFLFVGHIRGLDSAFNMLGTEVFRNSSSYNWAVIPFFVLMGYYCLNARFGEDLYDSAHKWFGHMRGGLGIATVGAGAAFASIVGDSLSSVATIGAVALPEMRKFKYSDLLSAGSIIAGATLGPIIPPSTAFIIYGLLTGVSVRSLLISGIIPGLILAVFFMLEIYIWVRLKPEAGPAGVKYTWKPRLISLKAGGPVLILFLLVMGGIWMGVFTPTEGGAIGACVALILGLIWRRTTWKTFAQTLLDAGKVISMIFMILIGAVLFTRFLAWCNVSATLSNFILDAGMSQWMYVTFTLILLFVLGFAIDILPLMLICIPVLHPIAVSLGIDPIWFACLTVITINLGDITPPVGVSLFALKTISKDLPVGTVFKGALIPVIGTTIVLIILVAVPPLITWLPGLMK